MSIIPHFLYPMMVIDKEPIRQKFPGGLLGFYEKFSPSFEDRQLMLFGHMGGETLFDDICRLLEPYGICVNSTDPDCVFACTSSSKRNWLHTEKYDYGSIFSKKGYERTIPVGPEYKLNKKVLIENSGPIDFDARRLIKFYQDKGKTSSGYTFTQIMNWNAKKLEETHDYIQWLFPIEEPSGCNPKAPLLSRQFLAAYYSDPILRGSVIRAILKMLRFFGISKVSNSNYVWSDAKGQYEGRWCALATHNQMRLTRMIIFMRLTGFYSDSVSLHGLLNSAMIENGYEDSRALGYWKEAVRIG